MSDLKLIDIINLGFDELEEMIHNKLLDSNIKPDTRSALLSEIQSKLCCFTFITMGDDLSSFNIKLFDYIVIHFKIYLSRTKKLKRIDKFRNGCVYEYKKVSYYLSFVGSRIGSSHFDKIIDFVLNYSYQYGGESYVSHYSKVRLKFNLPSLSIQEIITYNIQDIFIKSSKCMCVLSNSIEKVTYLVTPSRVREQMKNGNLLFNDIYGIKRESIKEEFGIDIPKTMLNAKYINYLEIEKEIIKTLTSKL